MPNAETKSERIIRVKDICNFMEISRPTLYRAIKKGDFPPPLKYGRGFSWFQSDVQKHLGTQAQIN